MRATAKGRHKPGEMNKLEAAYAATLELRQRAGEVAWFAFESVTFKLAKRTTYTPDFAVMLADESMEFHEVKGFMRDDAHAKLKITEAMFPFRFVLVRSRAKKDGGGWDVQTVGGEP